MELHSFFEDDKCVYLVTELCPNGELFQYVQQQKEKRLSEDQARTVLKQVVQGLDYMHSHSIIHRDLKLSNLLLNEQFEIVRFCPIYLNLLVRK